MPVEGPIPQGLLTVVAAATVFSMMFTLGLDIVLAELRAAFAHPGPLGRALFAVLVVVPVIALGVTRVLGLERWAEIGIVLMAIAPGAPVALRRSIAAGGSHAFAPVLQVSVALLAIVSMPLSIAALNLLYAGHAAISPVQLARQVLLAQLLPLCLGVACRIAVPGFAKRVEPHLARLSGALLLVLAVLVVLDVWLAVVDAGANIALAAGLVTLLALGVGHWVGGPDSGTRSATAISCALRNLGLALLVATVNDAPVEVTRTLLAYFVVSAITVSLYVLWRRRVVAGGGGAGGSSGSHDPPGG